MRRAAGPIVVVGALIVGAWSAEVAVLGMPVAKKTPPAFTEDTDTNDGGTPNNVVDDGDNQHPSGRDRSVEPGGSGNQGNSPSDPDGDSNGGPDKPNGPGGVDLADQDGNNGCGNDDDFEDDNEGWCGRKPERTKPATTKPEATEPERQAQGEHERPATAADRHDEGDEDVAPARTHPAPTPPPSAGGETVVLPVVVPDRIDVLPAVVTPAAAEDDVVEGEVLGLELEADDTPRGMQAATTGGAVSAELAATTESASTSPAVFSAAAGALAFTGDHLLVLMAIAVAALAIGAALVQRARRTEA